MCGGGGKGSILSAEMDFLPVLLYKYRHPSTCRYDTGTVASERARSTRA